MKIYLMDNNILGVIWFYNSNSNRNITYYNLPNCYLLKLNLYK